MHRPPQSFSQSFWHSLKSFQLHWPNKKVTYSIRTAQLVQFLCYVTAFNVHFGLMVATTKIITFTAAGAGDRVLGCIKLAGRWNGGHRHVHLGLRNYLRPSRQNRLSWKFLKIAVNIKKAETLAKVTVSYVEPGAVISMFGMPGPGLACFWVENGSSMLTAKA